MPVLGWLKLRTEEPPRSSSSDRPPGCEPQAVNSAAQVTDQVLPNRAHARDLANRAVCYQEQLVRRPLLRLCAQCSDQLDRDKAVVGDARLRNQCDRRTRLRSRAVATGCRSAASA